MNEQIREINNPQGLEYRSIEGRTRIYSNGDDVTELFAPSTTFDSVRVGYSRQMEPVHVLGESAPVEFIPGDFDITFNGSSWNTENISWETQSVEARDPFEEFRDEMQSLKDRISQLEMLLLEN